MRIARTEIVFLTLAALLLSGSLVTFPHDHGVSEPVPGDPAQPCPESHLHGQDSPSADDCTICFFNRLAGHGQAEAAGLHPVAEQEALFFPAIGGVPGCYLASCTEARGPPIA